MKKWMTILVLLFSGLYAKDTWYEGNLKGIEELNLEFNLKGLEDAVWSYKKW